MNTDRKKWDRKECGNLITVPWVHIFKMFGGALFWIVGHFRLFTLNNSQKPPNKRMLSGCPGTKIRPLDVQKGRRFLDVLSKWFGQFFETSIWSRRRLWLHFGSPTSKRTRIWISRGRPRAH